MSVLTPRSVFPPGQKPRKAEIIQLLEAMIGGTAVIGDYQGAWSGGVAYVEKDYVEYGGSLWIAQRANTGVTPIEGADWELLLPGVTVADGTVTTAKLAAGAVTEAKLASTMQVLNMEYI